MLLLMKHQLTKSYHCFSTGKLRLPALHMRQHHVCLNWRQTDTSELGWQYDLESTNSNLLHAAYFAPQRSLIAIKQMYMINFFIFHAEISIQALLYRRRSISAVLFYKLLVSCYSDNCKWKGPALPKCGGTCPDSEFAGAYLRGLLVDCSFDVTACWYPFLWCGLLTWFSVYFCFCRAWRTGCCKPTPAK